MWPGAAMNSSPPVRNIGGVRRDRTRRRYGGRKRPPQKSFFKRAVLVALLVVLLLGLAAGAQLRRALPPARASVVLPDRVAAPSSLSSLPWPSNAAAAVEIEGIASLGGVRTNEVWPLASVAKLFTALVVLKDHPLVPGQSGPAMTVTAAGVATYRRDLAQAQSVVAVVAGEHLSELQALEAMLVASGNNVAYLLAQWAAGGAPAFVQQMNAEAARLGLTATHLADPSGLDPASVGTAADMVRLAAAVMANRLLRQVVAMPQVTLPVAGTVYNYDTALGRDGIVGVKTGSTTQAGGDFVFAARRRLDGRSVSVLGAVLGAGGVKPLRSTLNDAEKLASAAFRQLSLVTVVPVGEHVLDIKAPWGASAEASSARPARVLAIPGEVFRLEVAPLPVLRSWEVRTLTAGERLATVEVRGATGAVAVPVLAPGPVPPAPLSYRLLRP